MRAKRLKKIYFVCLVMLISSMVAGLIIYALNQNINLFYTPTQVINQEAPLNVRIRVGGMVEKGSVQRQEGVALEFVITDFQQRLKVHYAGVLPDLFREGQGVVVTGQLQGQEMFKTVFRADQIFAKHDENYMPPEVAQSLKRGKDTGRE